MLNRSTLTTFCASFVLFEEWKWCKLPIKRPVFVTGPAGSQGPDRAVAISKKILPGEIRLFTYCLAVTHSGATPEGAFDHCNPM